MAHARTVTLFGLGLQLLLPGSVSAQPADIRTIDCPGAASTIVGGINDAGRAVGVYFDVLPMALGGFHGFIWEGGRCDPIPGLPDDALPMAQNDAGQVIGVYVVPSGSEARGFVYRSGQLEDLLCPAGEPEGCLAWPRGVNNRGQIVGYYEREGPDGPFMWQDGSYVALADLPLAHITVRARGINPRGDIVGEYYRDYTTPPHITYGYSWPSGGTPVSFAFPIEGNDPPVAKTTVPQAITPRGGIVGYFYDSMYDDDSSLDGVLIGPSRGFFRDGDGAMIELKVPGATYTCPMGINAAGEVSGVYTTNAAETPLATITWRGFVAKVEALVVR
jgi:hypothetical protein